MLRVFSIVMLCFFSSVSFAEEKVDKEDVKDNKPSSNISSANSLGIATWRSISRQESKVSLPTGEDQIKRNKGLIALDNPNVYAEILVFSNGTIAYKRDGNRSAIPSESKTKQRVNELNKLLKKERLVQLGITKLKGFKHETITGDEKQKYLLTTAHADSNKAHCEFFYKALSRDSHSALAQRATGVFCFPKKSGRPLAEDIENVASIAQQMAFDDGVYAQANTLAGLTKVVHDYWSKQDHEAPIIKLAKAEFNENSVFIQGHANDSSSIGFIKVNGERLSDSDFNSAIDDSGNFTVYVKSKRPFSKASITVGDKYGNSKTQRITQKVASVSKSGSPILFDNSVGHKTYALLVAVSNYELHDLKTLYSPPVDVRLIKDTLVSSVGLPSNQITSLNNPKKQDFLDAVNKIRKGMLYGDQLLVYFSGHGTVYKDKVTGDDYGYWLFSDTTEDPKTWLSNQEVKNLLSGFSDGGIMLIADSCFSGNFVAEAFVDANNLDFKNSEEARAVLTAAGNNPVPDAASGSNSAFALAVSESLGNWMQKIKSMGKSTVPGFMVYRNTLDLLESRSQKSPRYGSFNKSDDGRPKDFMYKKGK